MRYTDNATAFLLVIVIILAAFVVLGIAAHVGMLIERRCRKRGATRISKWRDARTINAIWQLTMDEYNSFQRQRRNDRGVAHLARDPEFIPEWLRDKSEPISMLLRQAE